MTLCIFFMRSKVIDLKWPKMIDIQRDFSLFPLPRGDINFLETGVYVGFDMQVCPFKNHILMEKEGHVP